MALSLDTKCQEPQETREWDGQHCHALVFVSQGCHPKHHRLGTTDSRHVSVTVPPARSQQLRGPHGYAPPPGSREESAFAWPSSRDEAQPMCCVLLHAGGSLAVSVLTSLLLRTPVTGFRVPPKPV